MWKRISRGSVNRWGVADPATISCGAAPWRTYLVDKHLLRHVDKLHVPWLESDVMRELQSRKTALLG